MKKNLNDYASVYLLVDNQCFEIELTHLEVGYDFKGTGVKIEGHIMPDQWRKPDGNKEERRLRKTD